MQTSRMQTVNPGPPPRVSIGMPVFNGEDFIREALDSILAQTFRDFELIISDNASTDGTEAICKAYAAQDSRIRYVRNPANIGAAGNYNAAFRLARGEYFKWAAHDDVCLPTFVERCVEIMDRQPTVVVCSPKALIIDAEGHPNGHYPHSLVFSSSRPSERFRAFFKTLGFHPIFGLIRTRVLAQTGLIANFEMGDRVLLGELVLWGEFAEVPEYLFLRRKHPNISTQANRTDRQLAAWFDPANNHRLLLPRWRRLVMYARGIDRSPLDWTERLLCYLCLARFAFVPRKWEALAGDLVRAARSIPSLYVANRLKREEARRRSVPDRMHHQ